MTELSTQELSFSFASKPILRDISFDCSSGEFISILGASGCGKSTLLRLIAGLLRPQSGRVLIDGQSHEQVDHSTSFVFQHPTLCPWRDVLSNVELPLELDGVAIRRRRHAARMAVELVGLSRDDERKLPRQLSGGMQMRASLARALVTQPKIMLLDEPFSAVDEVLRQQLSETCLELWLRERWTTILVTHNVAEAVFMSQRILILTGTPATIVDRIEVPFQDRTEELRTSANFAQFVAMVSHRLRQSVEQHSVT